MISIILPIYNVEKYLSKCLDSLLEQTYDDFELICVNDGSTDNSLNILQNYASKDSRIKIINQKNQGQSMARNNALEKVQGDYISFIDSDDWVEKDFLENLISSAQKNDADVVQSGYIQCNKIFVRKEKTCISFENIMEEMQKCLVWNKLWKTDFVKKNHLYFLPNVTYQDVFFCCMASFYSKSWNIINYAGYHYVVNPLSATQNQSFEKIKKRRSEKQIVCSEVIDFFKQKNCTSKELNSVENFLISQLLENSDLINIDTYKAYKRIFGNNKLLIKKRHKAMRKWLFQFSFKKKKFILLGHSFWKNNKI